MAKTDSSKSKAEAYREERKARLAKAAKKNAKGLETGRKIKGIAKKVVSIVIVAAIVVGALAILDNYLGTSERFTTAVKIGNQKISTAQFNYYYKMQYQQITYYADYYTQNYGYNLTGYDTSLSPDAQTTQDEDGNEISWADQFRKNALDQAQYVLSFYKEAVAAGVTLSEDEENEINETINNYRESAASSNFSLNAYLRNAFGSGFNEKVFKKQLQMESLAKKFAEQKQNELTDAVTDEQIQKVYDADKKSYDYTDVRYYKFALEVAVEGEDPIDNSDKIAEAKDVFSKITANDEASFKSAVEEYESKDAEEVKEETPAETEETAETADAAEEAEASEPAEAEEENDATLYKHTSYSTLQTAIGDEAADWAFDEARKEGEVKFFESESACVIVYIVRPDYASNSIAVRHCLVQFETDDESSTPTAEQEKAALEKAEKLLKEWEDGDATEDSFAKMATDNTDDPGSASNGGLYDEVRLGDMVAEFEDWCFDASRKPGDTGLVKTTYGYHIMYFVKNNKDDFDWKNTIKETEGNDAFTSFQDELIANPENAIKEYTFFTNKVQKKCVKVIAANLASSAR